jgi:DnaK suppressor protein
MSLKKVNEKLVRKRLLALRDELQAAGRTAAGSAAIVELDQSKVGRLSRMDALQAQAMAQASGIRREATLRDIAVALRRIDNGDYGNCLECEEPINPKRLEFDPTLVLCINCAKKTEQS